MTHMRQVRNLREMRAALVLLILTISETSLLCINSQLYQT